MIISAAGRERSFFPLDSTLGSIIGEIGVMANGPTGDLHCCMLPAMSQ
jgi:hypothetical protein